ncbi:MAG: hypothetical protein ACI8P3_003745, partial [Saprospiraceae bacterium]
HSYLKRNAGLVLHLVGLCQNSLNWSAVLIEYIIKEKALEIRLI